MFSEALTHPLYTLNCTMLPHLPSVIGYLTLTWKEIVPLVETAAGAWLLIGYNVSQMERERLSSDARSCFFLDLCQSGNCEDCENSFCCRWQTECGS
ncbi:hypothetical protein TNCV_164301 [Trichonephila clavipes]|nr:hypothetical protein TNCV_164301 [Trichonephila clavipes]